jgi:hypothetical protein
MGRTIHYNFKLSKDLDQKRVEKLIAITDEYNEKYTWTCENVGFSNFGFYPNWDYFRKSTTTAALGTNEIWKIIDAAYKSNEKYKMSHLDNIMNLRMKRLIRFHQMDIVGNPDLKEFRGFTKVAGNEWNALLTLAWLVEVSKLIPEAMIAVYDEGEFLKIPIYLKNAKARPDWTYIKSKKAHCQKNIEDYWAKPYLERLDNGIKDYESAPRITMNFVSPAVFTRNVNPKDFEKHPEFRTMTINAGSGAVSHYENIMAGFGGEYWTKKGELVELRSEQSTEFILNILGGLVNKPVDE